MNVPLRCACGQISGHIGQPQRAGRAICYCRDRQAFARFLGWPEQTLDAQGGAVAATPWPMLQAALKIAGNVGGAQLSGRYKDTPFFKPGAAEPIVPPQVLSAAQRQALRAGP